MTIAREDMGEDVGKITEPVSLYYNETLARYVRDPDSTVKVLGHRAAVTLKHFSPHAIADGKMAQSVVKLGRSSDLDGDGDQTPSDALFMLVASGGTQKATASLSQKAAGSVRRDFGNGELARTPRNGQSFQFGTARLRVSAALPRAAARAIAEKFSMGNRWEKPTNITLDVEAGEYEFDCKLLLGRYGFHRATSWERVTLGSEEMRAIRQGWDTRTSGIKLDNAHGHFEYFILQSGERHIIAPALPGPQKIAVSENETGLVVYVQRESFIIAKLRRAVTDTCPNDMEPALWASTDKAVKGARGHKARQKALETKFHFGKLSKETGVEQHWGTFNREELNVYSDMKCKSEQSQVWNYAVSWDQTYGISQQPSRSGVTARTWTTPSTTAIVSGAPSADLQAASSVAWSISNTAARTSSQHLTAGLFKATPEGQYPSASCFTELENGRAAFKLKDPRLRACRNRQIRFEEVPTALQAVVSNLPLQCPI